MKKQYVVVYFLYITAKKSVIMSEAFLVDVSIGLLLVSCISGIISLPLIEIDQLSVSCVRCIIFLTQKKVSCPLAA